MFLLTQKKTTLWKVNQDNLSRVEIVKNDGGTYNLNVYIINPVTFNYPEKRIIAGMFQTEEKAKEQLKSIMHSLIEDKYIIVEDDN